MRNVPPFGGQGRGAFNALMFCFIETTYRAQESRSARTITYYSTNRWYSLQCWALNGELTAYSFYYLTCDLTQDWPLVCNSLNEVSLNPSLLLTQVDRWGDRIRRSPEAEAQMSKQGQTWRILIYLFGLTSSMVNQRPNNMLVLLRMH